MYVKMSDLQQPKYWATKERRKSPFFTLILDYFRPWLLNTTENSINFKLVLLYININYINILENKTTFHYRPSILMFTKSTPDVE